MGQTPADAPAPSDSTGQASLRVLWTSMPPIPGPIKNDIAVASATFSLGQLQVVGDGGSASSTTLEDVELAWSAAQPMPATLTFDAPPIGRYSKITFALSADQGGEAFALTGAVRIGAVLEPFRIYDTEHIQVEVGDYNVEVEPGRSATMTVQLDLKATLEDLDYEAFPVVDGVRTLGPTDPQIVQVRETLTDAFDNF